MALKKQQDDTPIYTIGGINKKTSKANPSFKEGYYVGKTQVPNRFNEEKPQTVYLLQGPEGEFGVYGKAGMSKAMNRTPIGHFVRIESTNRVKDTGKGNPMKEFDVYVDDENTIDVDSTAHSISQLTDTTDESEEYSESEEQEYTPPHTTALPTRPAVSPDAVRQAKVKELLAKTRR